MLVANIQSAYTSQECQGLQSCPSGPNWFSRAQEAIASPGHSHLALISGHLSASQVSVTFLSYNTGYILVFMH